MASPASHHLRSAFTCDMTSLQLPDLTFFPGHLHPHPVLQHLAVTSPPSISRMSPTYASSPAQSPRVCLQDITSPCTPCASTCTSPRHHPPPRALSWPPVSTTTTTSCLCSPAASHQPPSRAVYPVAVYAPFCTVFCCTPQKLSAIIILSCFLFKLIFFNVLSVLLFC